MQTPFISNSPSLQPNTGAILKPVLPQFLLFLLVITALLIWQGWTEYRHFRDHQQQIVTQSAHGVAREANLLVQQLQRTLQLFAEDQIALLQRAAATPDIDSEAVVTLATKLQNHFPEIFAFTLSDADGHPLFEDFEQLMGKNCRDDIRQFISDGFAHRIRLHPHPLAYHFDIMTRIPSEQGSPGVFFVSIRPALFSGLLQAHQVHGMRILLINRSDPGLIELTAEGPRNLLDGQVNLDADERARIVISIPLTDTLWDLVVLPDPMFEQQVFSNIASRVLGLFIAMFTLSVAALAIINRTILEREAAEGALGREQAFFRMLLDSIHDPIFYKDLKGVYLGCNKAFSDCIGIPESELRGKTDADLFPPAMAQSYQRREQTTFAKGETNDREEWVHYPKGKKVLLDIVKTPLRKPSGELLGLIGIGRDITELKHSREQLDHLAHHDPLTGLPNRLLLNARLGLSLEQARRDNTQVGILYLDLDGFKHINDSLGHAVGDEVLKQIAVRLNSRTRAQDTVARLGGDEFVVVVGAIHDPRNIILLANKLLAELAEPIQYSARRLFVTGSIGICIYPQDGTEIETLLRNADASMYKAKEQGRNRYQFYAAEFTRDALEQLHMRGELRRALERQEFRLYFQPQIELTSGRLIGAEALIRWQHPTYGLLTPARFLQAAERSGQVKAIGAWVLHSACRQWVEWKDQGLVLDKVAVNLCGQQVSDPDLINSIPQILEKTGCPARHLELEVTENLAMRETGSTLETLEQLRTLGITLAIDDFGTGHSSLTYLKQLPIQKLKIDQSFICGIPDDMNDTAITRAVIGLGKSLQLQTIAEGVDKTKQQNFLVDEGCDQAQGNLFSQPVPANQFPAVAERFIK